MAAWVCLFYVLFLTSFLVDAVSKVRLTKNNKWALTLSRLAYTLGIPAVLIAKVFLHFFCWFTKAYRLFLAMRLSFRLFSRITLRTATSAPNGFKKLRTSHMDLKLFSTPSFWGPPWRQCGPSSSIAGSWRSPARCFALRVAGFFSAITRTSFGYGTTATSGSNKRE